MNNSINYSGFIEMFLESDDDFEPYGCVNTLTSDGQQSRACGQGLAKMEEDVGDD